MASDVAEPQVTAAEEGARGEQADENAAASEGRPTGERVPTAGAIHGGGADGASVRETPPVGYSSKPAHTLDRSIDERDERGIVVERQRVLRKRHAMVYWGADFLGFAQAIFFSIVFMGIVVAIERALQLPNRNVQVSAHFLHLSQTMSIGTAALIGWLIAAFLGYVLGGYTAGRMARFGGMRNALGVWIWTIVLGVAVAAAQAVSTAFGSGLSLGLSVSRQTMWIGGAALLGMTLAVMLAGSLMGGILGARYHRAIDSLR